MATGSAPAKNGPESFLAENEEPVLQWEGALVEDEDTKHPANFVATNSRLILSLGGGHFKDVGLEHIESVEAGAETQRETEGMKPGPLKALGGISIVMGVLAMVLGGGSGLSILAGLSFVGLGLYGIVYASNHHDEMLENFEVSEYDVYHILLKTDAASAFAMPIYIETRKNVGPELSRLVQESGS